MKHRTQDHLFAAAGVTAALSLIGTGATVLKGSVFHFDHWPLVAGDSARGVNLPTAPIQVAEATTPSGQSTRQALLAGATRTGGTAALLPGLGGQTGITAIGTTIPAPSGTTLPASATEGAGNGSRGGSTSATTRVAVQDGSGYSVGPQPSSSIDGTRDPAGSSSGTTTSTGAPRVASGDDTDGDGIPDTWEKNHGAPSNPTDASSNGTSTSVGDHDGQSPTGSAFNPDPGTPTTTDPGTPATTDPGTGSGDTGSGDTGSGDGSTTTPPPTDTGSGDGSGTTTPTDGSTQPPADTTTPPPADTTPPAAPADPAPPADTTATQTAPAPSADAPAPAANAAVPSSVQ